MSRPTDSELDTLVKFREVIADFEMRPEQRTTVALLTWLRAREMNIPKAAEMLKKSLLWRKENDIYTVLDWKAPDWFAKVYPYEICGRGKDGCPVLIFPFGRWNMKKAVDAGEGDNWLRLIDQMLTKLEAETNKVNLEMGPDDYPISQFIWIIDYTGFSLRQMTSIGSLQTTLAAFSRFDSNYPECIKTIFCVNAPRTFSMFYALVKPLLSPHTTAKIKVFGSNEAEWIPELQKLISPDQLPLLLGGTKKNSCGFLAKDHVYGTRDEKVEPDEEVEYIDVVVKACQKLTLEFEVTKRNSTITWTFETESYDIGFSITRKNKEIVPFQKYESHLNKQTGTLKCEKTGAYIVAFDNTYSKFYAKNLRYMVILAEPEREKK